MKRVLSMLLALVLVSSIVLSMPAPAAAESLYIRKIVSVVYDDSRSMLYNDKFAYANYAMQAFCGMLNSEDQLYITYMNDIFKGSNTSALKDDFTPTKVDLSAGGIQNSVNAIRAHDHDGGYTPFPAVEKAFDHLKGISDSNPNTQYWLVVISDGSFTGGEHKKAKLNEIFSDYTSQVMPNGTNPQVTYFGIGIADNDKPDTNEKKGIYTYEPDNATEVISAMNSMADKISGRTRLQSSDIKKVDSKTIQVSSSIPLLNIAVLAQRTGAKITKAVQGSDNIPVSRSASLSYSGYSDLSGGAFLLGNSTNVIEADTYTITFDKDVNLDDLVVLFEPALETRVTISLNGQPITDLSELNNAMARDKLSVSCKVYEMGTDKEVDPSLLPPGTKFSVSILEDGNVVKESTDKSMALTDYELKETPTEIKAMVTITGFSPIVYSAKFTPTQYVPKIVYTMEASFANGVKSVKFDDIASNKDMSILFTVFADGVPMTDVEAVKALNPVVEISPQGNSGVISYSNDGKIVFTPNTAGAVASTVDSFNVDVSCTLSNGVSAKETYTVLIASYEVIPQNAANTVKKTELFGNKESVSFYITKDGVRLDKAAVESQISVLLNEEQAHLKTQVTVAPDGLITVTPYSEEEHVLTFWNWWTNWAYYFGLAGEDITVTMSHAYGTASATVDVVEEGIGYQILCVYLPLLIEIVALTLLIIWIILIVTKPRYLNGAKLYTGTIRYNAQTNTHILRDFSPCNLAKFNLVKRGNGRLEFKKTAKIVSANGVKIRADHGGRIICEMPGTWYKDSVKPANNTFLKVDKPADLAEYMSSHPKLEIREFSVLSSVDGNQEKVLTPGNSSNPKYFVIPDDEPLPQINGRSVIKTGTLFIYIID